MYTFWWSRRFLPQKGPHSLPRQNVALYENIMNSLLASLIDAFLTKVRESEDIMKVHFNVEEPRFFRQNDISRSGQFGTFKYSFHGIGCRFSYKKRTVDYDYGDGGRIDGLICGVYRNMGNNSKSSVSSSIAVKLIESLNNVL
jgi:hypothetical protein